MNFKKLLLYSLFFFLASPIFAQEASDFTIQNQLIKKTVVLNNEKAILPLSQLESRKITSIYPPSEYPFAFNDMLNKYAKVETGTLLDHSSYNTLILYVNDRSLQYAQTLNFLMHVPREVDVIIAGFGSLTSLAKLDGIDVPIVWSETNSINAEKVSAAIIFGGLPSFARLQRSVSSRFKKDSGYSTSQIRLRYGSLEAVGINAQKLHEKIDFIADEAIREKATPGAVVMIVKDQQVIFEKAYGTHTYDGNKITQVNDIFDLASISKIAATTLAVMNLTENGKINLNESIGHYLKDARKTDKADIRLRDVILHQAGFIPFIPFYRDLEAEDHRSDSSAAYPTKVAEGYYLRKNYFNDVMWPKMLDSPVKPSGKYVYSDISMYVMQKVIEEVTKTSLEEYVQKQFYEKLGMKNTGYNPWKRFPKDRIIPTERDSEKFRDTLLQGYVHDEGAAMANGVAGHAGLFSTANDLAIYGQMLLNRGEYGSVEYFKPETVDLFTSKQAENSRRGLGFDRFEPDRSKEYPSRLASEATYGHTGYTGTCIWIDPENQLVYIFLSNRVHPKVNNKLFALNTRSRILDAVYEGIEENLTKQ